MFPNIMDNVIHVNQENVRNLEGRGDRKICWSDILCSRGRWRPSGTHPEGQYLQIILPERVFAYRLRHVTVLDGGNPGREERRHVDGDDPAGGTDHGAPLRRPGRADEEETA